MEFEISFQTAVLAFFFLQGLIFGALLLRAGWRNGHLPSYWLSLFVVLCSAYLVPFMAGYQGWYGKAGYRDFLFFVPFQQFFLIGPVIYCYVKSQLNPGWRIGWREAWHFLPGVLYLGYSLLVFVTDVFLVDEYYFYADGRDKDLASWYQISGLLVMIVYTVFAIRLFWNYRRRIYEELSFAEAVAYRWVGHFLLALLAIMSLRIFALVFLPEWGDFGRWFPYYTAFGAIAYYIALAGYTNVVRAVASQPLHEATKAPLVEEVPEVVNPTETDVALWKPKVVALMEDKKLYENPTLTLTDVAAALGVNRRQASGIINQAFGDNFNDFVNRYRVEAVKARFAQGEQDQFTILSIALACGFNSKTTFNRAFKKYTARTPVQYLAEMSRGGNP